MKVYAEYLKKGSLEYRKNTILQLGNSWNLIGNIVLANPGSAKPNGKIDDNIETELQNFYKNFKDRQFDATLWHEFKDDATMRIIKNLFNGWYIDKDNTMDLNGVIQLFNSFNVKNQNLNEAINAFHLDDQDAFSIGIEKYFNDKPTYFGFGKDVSRHDKLGQIAKDIFDNSSNKIKSIYKSKFEENLEENNFLFYHPRHINQSYKKEKFKKYMNEILIPLFKNLS